MEGEAVATPSRRRIPQLMECLCLFAIVTLITSMGFYRFYAGLSDTVFGTSLLPSDDDALVSDADDELEDDVDIESLYQEEESTDWEEDPDEVEADRGSQEPVDVRALLDSTLPTDQYAVFHDVPLKASIDEQPLPIDHVIVSIFGVLCIRRLEIEGQIDTMPGEEEWLREMGTLVDYFDSPRDEIRRTARALGRELGLKPDQVVGIVVSAGRGDFIDKMPPNVYYARDLPLTIDRRKTIRLTDAEVDNVRRQLSSGG